MRDDQIEIMARKICVELGLDPDSEVMFGYGDDMTPIEYEGVGSSIPAIALYGKKWRLYRGHAAIALAATLAVQSGTPS